MTKKKKEYNFKKGNKLATANAYNFTEAQIRYAMAHTVSNADAARFLNVYKDTYKKYAKMYVDAETGKTLWELHKHQGKGVTGTKKKLNGKGRPMEDIFANKHPDYPKVWLKKRVLRGGYLPERCDNCGFCERRITDNTVPLLVDFIDGNETNMALENIRMLCYNCTYLLVGNFTGGRKAKIKNDDWRGY